MTADEFFRRILDPNAGYRCVIEQEMRERKRWERNALKRTRAVDAKTHIKNIECCYRSMTIRNTNHR